MFDKIQSTYFKRVTTGVLALFMTASSGFSYAVPVYAEEVTTAAAKRKKEEEFSSTESSTLQLNENSTKEEVKNDQDTGNDDVKVTTNGSSEDQPEVTYEKPDMKEPGRKLSSEEAQKDLKKIIESKKYSYEGILQRIFEIDDFSFYSSLTSDDIKFLMSGKTEEKYEILEILKLKSVNYYDYNSLSPKKFYLSLFSYFKLIDQCDEELSKDVKKQIQDQVLKDINQFYIKEKSLYYKNINDFYVNDMQDFENVSKEDGAKYVDAISTYIYTKSDERDKNVIRKALDLEEVDEDTDEKELEDWATNNKDGPFTIKDHLDSLKGTEESYNQGGDYGYSTNNYFYVTIHDKGGNDTNATINITGRSSKYGNKDKKLYQRMLKNQTTWNCSMTINGANNHNLKLTHNTVTTAQDKFKGTDGQYAWFIMNFKISYTRHSYYYNKGCSYDKNDADIRFNTKNYTLNNTGDDGNSIERGYTSYDKPVTANIQINTGHTGTRTFKHYRYRGGRVTINYTRETHTIRYDANGGYGAPGNQTKTMGVDLWLSSTTPSRSQYVFKGWNTQANGSGTSYSPGQQFYPDADTTLYAQWEEDTSYQYLDVNGVLDGNQANNTDGMGKFDVYINGQLVSDPSGSIDFYDKYKVGSKYEIKNIRPNSGISYDHASPGLSGTITGYTSVNLYFNTGYTLSIDPNGGTYLGSKSVHTVEHLSGGSYVTMYTPTRQGYKFGGFYAPNAMASWGASGWTNSIGTDPNGGGTYSENYQDGEDRNNDSGPCTQHTWSNISATSDVWNHIEFPTYTAEAGHTYEISGQVWISQKPSGGDFQLNFYHGDSCNDWQHNLWSISEGYTGKWVKFSMKRTFDTTTSDARFEVFTSSLKGLTGNVSFWLQGLKITDLTTGNDVPLSKVQMPNDNMTVTARWIPLHSTLSYDAQGGSLGSVKSTDNPNNYKIVDNGDYFIQSGLNSSRYLHDYDCSTENGAKVCTFQGYGANAKQCIWTFERYKNTPYYYIINKYNGKALNLSGDGPGDLSGQTVEMWTQLNAANENQSDFLWYFKDAGDGYVTICNKYTDKALDIPNGEDNDNVKLQQYTPNGTASQKFKLVNNSSSKTIELKQDGKVKKTITVLKAGSDYIDSEGKKIELKKHNGQYMIIRDGEYLNSAKIMVDSGEHTFTTSSGSATIKTADKINGNDLYLTLTDSGNYKITTNPVVWSRGPMTRGGNILMLYIKGKNITSDMPHQVVGLQVFTQEFYSVSGPVISNSNIGNLDGTLTYDTGYDSLDQITDEDGSILPSALFDLDKDPEATTTNGIDFPTREKYTDSNVYINSATPVKKGCKFLGWSTSANGNVVYQPGDLYDVNQDGGNVTLYAQWEKAKYTATVKLNGGSYNGSTKDFTISKYPGEEISVGAPTRSKHNFAGYKLTMDNNDGDAPTSVTQSASGFKGIMQMGNFTLNAQWTPWKHTVRYDANAKNDTSVKGIPASQSKTANVDIKLSSDVPTRNGYTFLGWNTKADGTGTSYEVKGNYNHDQNGGTVTLYAIWTPWVHTVHYDANGGDQSSVPNDQKKTYGQSMNVATKVPTRNEYKFLGWTTGKDGSGTFYNPGDAYYHDQNGQTVTLYAKWVQLYTVKYDGNQPAIKGVTVTGSVANQTQGQDESVNLRTNNFKNDSGVYKDWSVGKDAYKYKVRTGNTEYNQYIHPEGFETNHSAMQNELRGYRRLEDTMIQN